MNCIYPEVHVTFIRLCNIEHQVMQYWTKHYKYNAIWWFPIEWHLWIIHDNLWQLIGLDKWALITWGSIQYHSIALAREAVLFLHVIYFHQLHWNEKLGNTCSIPFNIWPTCDNELIKYVTNRLAWFINIAIVSALSKICHPAAKTMIIYAPSLL